MNIVVAANRLGFHNLAQQCERKLSLHLGENFPYNAENCLQFAQSYNLMRLEKQCIEVLRRNKNFSSDF
jgi:hypothetical protein